MKKARRLGLVLGLIMLAGALAPAVPETLDANKALAREQLKLASQALGDLDRKFRGGEASIDDPRVTLWERRKVEALRASGVPKAEVVAAVEGYVKRMKVLEQVAKRQYEQNVAERLSVHEAAYRTLEAEMWLNEEKAR
jgi:hypothetical protein